MTNNENIYKDFLLKAGLSTDQANVYEVLLKNGVLPARKISLIAGMKRPMCYKVIDQLVDMELIEKIDKKVLLFAPAHPDKVTDMLLKQRENLKVAEQSLKSVLGSMISDYNLYSGKPNVRFFEGVEGVKKLYDDILLEKKDILLIRSPFDSTRPELNTLVEQQIKNQVKYNIHTQAITPIEESSIKTAVSMDSERLVTRCLISNENFKLPAQIIIYGDKVGMTSYKEHLVTTIIQNPDIKESFEILFNHIWKNAEKDSSRIISNAMLK